MSYPVALVFRHVLHPDHTPLMVRYVFSYSMGMLMGLLCFGWEQMALLMMIVMVSYLLLVLVPPQYTQRYGHAIGGRDSRVWFPQILHGVGHGEHMCDSPLQDGYRLWWLAFGLYGVRKQG